MKIQSLAPLDHKEYRYYVYSRFFYTMALRMISTVVAYQLFHLTQSSFSIGLVGLSEFIPVFVLALYAGHVIDRSDKRTLLFQSILSNSVCALALVVVSLPALERHLSTKALEYTIYFIIFCTGIVRSFAQPTSNAIVAQLIPRDILHLAANISSTSWLSASILGHAGAGFLIAGVGVNHTYMVIFILVVLAAANTWRIPKKPVQHNNVNIRTWDSVKEGLHFVFNHKVLLSAISLDLFAVLFGGAVALIPEFADRILKVGPIGFGWLNAASDIGSVIMIVIITLFPIRRRQGLVQLLVIAGFGLCVIGFGLSTVYWFSFLVLLIGGMFDGVNVVVRGNILQLTTPDEMRGRVSAVNSMFVNSSNELGQFESGFTAKLMGTVPAVIFGGSMTLVVVIITWLKAPGLRKFEY